MDDERWDQMMNALQVDLYPKVQTKLDHDLVRAYRSTFWQILKHLGEDLSDFQECPPHGVCTPDVPQLAFDGVLELKTRFDRLEEFVLWVSESQLELSADSDTMFRLNGIIDAAKAVLDDIST